MSFLSHIAAVAGLTLKEASRRRVYAVFLLFTVVLLCSAALLPYGGDQQIRLIQVWSLRSASVFSAIIAVFLAAAALPGDFEQRRIYVLATKPVSKFAIFLGRVAGFTAILAIFIALTCAASTLYLRILAAGTGTSESLRALPRTDAETFGTLVPGAWNDLPTRRPDRIRVARGNGLVWRFEGLDPAAFDDPLNLRARIDVAVTEMTGGFFTEAVLHTVGTDARPRWNTGRIWVIARDEIRAPVPRSEIADGTLTVALTPMTDLEDLAAEPRDLWLYGAPLPYEFNSAKCFGLLFLRTWIMLVVVLAASVWLSMPVSALVGFLVWLGGTFHGAIEDATTRLARSFDTPAAERGHSHEQEIPEWLLRVSTPISQAALVVIPDFGRSNPEPYLLTDLDLPWREFGRSVLWSLPYVAVPAILGMVLLMFKEFQ